MVDPSNEYIKAYKWTLQMIDYRNIHVFFGIDSSDKEFLDFCLQRNGGERENAHPFDAFTRTRQTRSINEIRYR